LSNVIKEEDMKRLVDLFLKMSFIGFDELKMEEREEFVRLLGEKFKSRVDSFYSKLSEIEERLEALERVINQ
jgi:hypothetical protein